MIWHSSRPQALGSSCPQSPAHIFHTILGGCTLLFICPCYEKCTDTGNLCTWKAPVHIGPNSTLIHLTENRDWGDFTGFEVEPVHYRHQSQTESNDDSSQPHFWVKSLSEWVFLNPQVGESSKWEEVYPLIDCDCLVLPKCQPCALVCAATVYWAKSVPDLNISEMNGPYSQLAWKDIKVHGNVLV